MKTTTPDLATFKTWCKDVAPAARAVLMARVFADMERERVDAYVQPIFETYGFQYGPLGNKCGLTGPIPTPKDLYLTSDLDDPRVKAFYAECDTAHRSHGFTGPAGHCPALRAEYLVMQAENALIDLASQLFGVDHVYGEDRKRYLELLIGACLKAE